MQAKSQIEEASDLQKQIMEVTRIKRFLVADQRSCLRDLMCPLGTSQPL